jgi:hypothetical protein
MTKKKAANAWLVVETSQRSSKFSYPQFALELAGDRQLYGAVAENDWLAAADASGRLTRVARVLRIRSDLKTTTFYFARLRMVNTGSTLAAAGLPLPKAGSMTRLQWSDFVAALPNLTGGPIFPHPAIAAQSTA